MKTYISKPDGSLKLEVVCKDNLCDLGKWINSKGQTLTGNHREFAKLKTHHAQFHKSAAEIIRKADSGQSVSEEIALGRKSDFAQASTTITQCLMRLRNSNAA